jgi:rubrerythrin
MVASLKLAWHRDLVADPVSHAWILNLYRAGERHPQTVDDYFPVAHAPWPELARELERHDADERRHERMYARAIASLDQPVEDLAGPDVFNEVIRACTPVSFRITDRDDEGARRDKLAHFLAHAHFLESRIARSLQWHLDACERARRPRVAAVVAAVLADEERHRGYTRAAVGALVPRRRAAEILDVHRRGEAKANLLFSQAQVRAFLAHPRSTLPRTRAALYRLCAFVMQKAAEHV